MLAHLSGDVTLQRLLLAAGDGSNGGGGDVFQLIARSWLHGGGTGGGVSNVSKEDREIAKRVTYGIIYGLSPYGLQVLRMDGWMHCMRMASGPPYPPAHAH